MSLHGAPDAVAATAEVVRRRFVGDSVALAPAAGPAASVPAMIRTAPPQPSHLATSIENSRFRRCAQPSADALDAPLPVPLSARSPRPALILPRRPNIGTPLKGLIFSQEYACFQRALECSRRPDCRSTRRSSGLAQFNASQVNAVPLLRDRAAGLPRMTLRYFGGRPSPGRIALMLSGVSASP